MACRKLVAAAVLLATVQAAPQTVDDPWSSTDWHKYVRSPESPTVKPARIVSQNTTGNVTNPEGFLHGSGPTILTRQNHDTIVPQIVIDFGLNVVGLPIIHFEGSESIEDGSPGLRLAFSEVLDALTDKSDYTRSYRGVHEEDKLTNGTDQIAVKDEKYAWIDKLGCEYDRKVCSDGLHGFRYMSIRLDALDMDAPHTSSIGSVSISSVELEWSAYLGTPDTFTGWFECSDKDITQWWYDGVYTVETNTDLFLKNETEPRDAYSPTLDGKWVLHDGAKRDRDPYVGDLAVASVTSYLSHDFPEASFNVLEDLIIHQREDGWVPPASINNYTLPLFDYPLWWVVCTVDLVMYTGDTTLVDKYWTNLRKVLDDYYPKYINPEMGVLDKKKEMDYGDYAFLPRSGPITYYNALYIHALSYAAQLASHLDHGEDAERWVERARQISPKLLDANWDSDAGAFFDGGPCPDADPGTVCNVHAQDGNSIAILSGVTNETFSKSILDYWSENTEQPYGNAFYDSSILQPSERFGERVYALISYFELQARFRTPDRAESALEEIRRLYGWMAAHDPEVTQWEGIGPGGVSYQGPFMSYAHGWSTGIVPLMSNYVLGVTPTKPGFKEWRVCPVVDGDLTWARGVVPTEDGEIKVAWEKFENGEKSGLNLEIEATGGERGVVCVPRVGKKRLVANVNGRAAKVEDGAIKLSSGRHSLRFE